MKQKNVVCLLMVFMLITNVSAARAADKKKQAVVESTVLKLNIDEAVKLGIANSIAMQKVKNQIEVSEVIDKNSQQSKKDLEDAEIQLNVAQQNLYAGMYDLYDSEAQLNAAQVLFAQDKLPQDITLPDGSSYPAGTDISAFGPLAATVRAQVQAQLDQAEQALKNGKARYEDGVNDYTSGEQKLKVSKAYAIASISNKLGTSTITELRSEPLGELMMTMSSQMKKITTYSYDIYKNQVAMLIQKNYYDVLKNQKLVQLREKTMERGQIQYNAVSNAYYLGLKAKEDVLLAETYYDSTRIAYEMAVQEYNKAMLELKKNLHLPADAQVLLSDVEADKEKYFNIEEGVESGLEKRLEIKTEEAKLVMYQQLKRVVSSSGYDENDNEYKEAELLLQKQELELSDKKCEIATLIRQSYETMNVLQKCLPIIQEMQKKAAENLEIARYKYEMGYPAESALMEKLNIESLSGTMAEVIASQENLAEIEGKLVEMTSGYNLARVKYLNDIGELPYK
ncbi:TolC family protein [Petroclostridium sp. X23]|uniref:TolC family protein n=1 Tax=Petroclostridium sp. X23 TaxID=3045146 RepID=UPI0024AE3B21|nr:TolC family protein [Petroclostridium sp. X23]WHH58847.1 TolC family protein [Petroclostridium sp. X23]